jgi:peptide deformylase
MPQKILQLGEPALHSLARELSKEEILSQSVQNLITTMQETMRQAPGVGLAAPQIGVLLQIAVIEDCEEYTVNMLPEIRKERGREPVKFHVIINPRITLNGKLEYFFESCLSARSHSRITPRSSSVVVECLDENAKERIIHAKGWYARILQHEIDHLKGRLYIDFADAKTEIINNDENRRKWINAPASEIHKFYEECLKNSS